MNFDCCEELGGIRKQLVLKMIQPCTTVSNAIYHLDSNNAYWIYCTDGKYYIYNMGGQWMVF